MYIRRPDERATGGVLVGYVGTYRIRCRIRSASDYDHDNEYDTLRRLD
jgi:hypothetical protein